MPQNPEYFISHIIDKKLEPETAVEKWPQHLTIIPPFSIDETITERDIFECVQENSREIGPIQLEYGSIRAGAIPLEIGNESLYGPENDLPVVEILDPSDKLHELHKVLMKKLGSIGVDFLGLNKDWIYDNYSPHVTVKNGSKISEPFFCTTLTIHKKTNETKILLNTIKMCK